MAEFRVEITERSLDSMTVRMTPREADPVQQAVDNYILMERKARAWDDLRAVAIVERWEKVLALMDLKGV